MRNIGFVIALLCSASCTNSVPETNKLALRYLREVVDLNPTDLDGVFVMQLGICGSCDIAVVSLVKDHVSRSSCRYAIILAAEDSSIINDLSRANPRILIRVDSFRLLERYGLRRARDAYYGLRDGEVWRQIDLHPSDVEPASRLLKNEDCHQHKVVNHTR